MTADLTIPEGARWADSFDSAKAGEYVIVRTAWGTHRDDRPVPVSKHGRKNLGVTIGRETFKIDVASGPRSFDRSGQVLVTTRAFYDQARSLSVARARLARRGLVVAAAVEAADAVLYADAIEAAIAARAAETGEEG